MNPLVLFAFVGLASAAFPGHRHVHIGRGLTGGYSGAEEFGLEGGLVQKEGTLYPWTGGLLPERGIAGGDRIIGVVGKPVPIGGESVGVQTEGIQGVKEVRTTPVLRSEIPVTTVEKVAKPIVTEETLIKVPVVQLYKPVRDLGVVGNVESEVFRQIPVGQKYYGQQIHRAFPYLFGEERPYVYGQEYPYYRKHEMSPYVYPYGQEHKQLYGQEYPFYRKHEMSSYVYPYGQEHKQVYGQEYPFYRKHEMSSYVYPYGQEHKYPHEMYRNEYPLAYENVAYPFRSGYEYPIYGKQYNDKSYVHGYPYYAKEVQYVQPENQIYRRHVPLAYEHISYPLRSEYQYVL